MRLKGYLLIILISGLASAQDLPTVDTYNDLWSDGTNVYLGGWFQVNGWTNPSASYAYHTYSQNAVFTSPSGRTTTCFSNNSVSAVQGYSGGCSAQIALNNELLDSWALDGSQQAYCTIAGTFFAAAWLPQGVGISGATYKNYPGSFVPSGTCEYELDCDSTPTCPNPGHDQAINNSYTPCGNYWIQQFGSFIFPSGFRFCYRLVNGFLPFPYVSGKSSTRPNPACT